MLKPAKYTKKAKLFVLALFIFTVATVGLGQKFNFSSRFGSVLAALTPALQNKFCDNSTLCSVFIPDVMPVGAATSPYQNVNSDVYISGNVGIGTTPTLATLQQSGMIGNTSAIFGSGNTGISLVTNWPGIYFNSYYNGGSKFMSSGYAGALNFDPTGGNIYFNLSNASGTAGGAASFTIPLYIANNGNVGIGTGTTTPSSKLQVNGTVTASALSGSLPWSNLTNLPTYAAAATNGRVRMADVGCAASWGSSCDANSNGQVDYADSAGNADTVDGWHRDDIRWWYNFSGVPGQIWNLNQWVNTDSGPTFNTVYTPNWFRSTGNSGWYNQSYGGGWFMQDTSYIRSYNNKHVYIGGAAYTSSQTQMNGNPFGWTDKGCTNCGDTLNGNPNLWLTAQTQVYIRSSNWNQNDVAELYPITDNADSTDLVSIDQKVDGFGMKKSTHPYDSNLSGVISETPAILFDGSGLIMGWDAKTDNVVPIAKDPYGNIIDNSAERKEIQRLKEEHRGKKPVALSGRIRLKVSSLNGPINQGDPVTSSTIPGVGMKATRAGQIIGKALEPFDDSKASPCQDNPQYQCQTILVFLNLSWYDPDINLISTQGFNISDSQVIDPLGSLVSRVGTFAEVIIGKLKAGTIEAQKLVVNGIDILEKLNNLSATVEKQQQTINQQSQEIQNLKEEVEKLKYQGEQ